MGLRGRKDIRVMGLVRERGGGVLEREDYRKEGFFCGGT